MVLAQTHLIDYPACSCIYLVKDIVGGVFSSTLTIARFSSISNIPLTGSTIVTHKIVAVLMVLSMGYYVSLG